MVLSMLVMAVGSDVYGSDVYGSDVYESDVYGSDVYGSDVHGSDEIMVDGGHLGVVYAVAELVLAVGDGEHQRGVGRAGHGGEEYPELGAAEPEPRGQVLRDCRDELHVEGEG